MSDPNKPDDVRPSKADVDDIADASIGVDTRIFRTLWDTLVHTPRVVEAAYAGDREKYVPIIRLFLVLFGLQFAIMALLNLPVGLSLETLAPDETSQAAVQVWLDESSESFEAVEATLQSASGWSVTIVSFLSSLPFLIMLKFYKWQRSFFGHLLAYLAATNASYIVMLPMMLLGAIGPLEFLFWGGFSLAMIVYFAATARILYRFYSQNAFVVALQTLGLVIILPITFLLMTIALLFIADFALQQAHDMSIWRLFLLSAEAAAQGNSQ
ncbi:hypothetical protein [Hyphobacterium sp.]|uniref:hypothetical protein n=1 Tax=Hyphobacterium sp. TaxID=2004662 RepID=UPI003BA9082B